MKEKLMNGFIYCIFFIIGFGMALLLTESNIVKLNQKIIITDNNTIITDNGLAFDMKYMFDKDWNAWGFYSDKGYFCVATAGREPNDVAETTYHELAHYYAEYDNYHFCEE